MKRDPFLEIAYSNTHFCGRRRVVINDPNYRRTNTQKRQRG
jgi:hypothetical protein